MSDKTPLPVRASDKVSDVLARDDKLVEVFARHSPHFAKLHNPAMRRVMARLVTIEQAAQIAGAESRVLVRELNRALGLDDAPDSPSAVERAELGSAQLKVVTNSPVTTGAPVVELDVRDDLRNGREPFSRIMAAVATLREGEVLSLRATFEPVPLFTVMKKRGFDHQTEQLATDDWRVWFFRNAVQEEEEEADVRTKAATREDTVVAQSASEIVLDVRGLEPPEPMRQTLEALEVLPDGAVLIQVNVRIPQFLLPILQERGFDYEIHEPDPERVVVRIWRASPDAAARAPLGRMTTPPPLNSNLTQE